MRLVMVAALVFSMISVTWADKAKHEDPRVTAVRSLYEKGTTHYNLSEFAAALTAYEEAYRLRSDPAFLFNIAQCYRQLGKPEQAARSYRAFLREAGAGATNREAVEKIIADMDAAVVAERAKSPPTGTESPKEAAVSQAIVSTSAGGAGKDAPQPLYKKWWLWTVVGVVVVGAVVGVAVGVTSQSGASFDANLGTVGPAALGARF